MHFLDVSRRDGREVANHFKWLANVFPVTFLFAGVGLRARGLLDEGLTGTDAAFSQTARRCVHRPVRDPHAECRRTWRKLLLGIERELVLAGSWHGMIADDLPEYPFARDHGIPVRSRGTSTYMPAAAAPGLHPRDLPEPLRHAPIGPRARRRLDRLVFIAGHPAFACAGASPGTMGGLRGLGLTGKRLM